MAKVKKQAKAKKTMAKGKAKKGSKKSK